MRASKGLIVAGATTIIARATAAWIDVPFTFAEGCILTLLVWVAWEQANGA